MTRTTALMVIAMASITAASSAVGAGLPLYQPEQLRTDLGLVRGALEEAHADPYRYSSKPDLDREWDRLAKSLDHPMNALEFYDAVRPVLALIKDGHLGWRVSGDVENYLDAIPMLPFGIRLGDKTRVPVVFRDLSDAEPSTGSEIVSVNEMPASKLVDEMWLRQMGDGDVISSRRRGVGALFRFELIRTANLRPPYEVSLRNPKSGKTEMRHYDGVLASALTERWRSRWPNDVEVRMERPMSELRFFDDNRIGYMRVPSFGSSEVDAKRRDLRGFFADAFTQLKDKKSEALIVDVRDNGGGEDEAGQILASYLIDKPFQYYRDLTVRTTSFKFADYITAPDPIPPEMINRGSDGRLHLTGHPNLGIKSPSQPNFRGALFIVMNGGSFSTAAEFLTAIRSKRPATFIGEESGGAYGGNNSGFEPAMTLPHTKLVLRIPLVAYYLDTSGDYPVRRGILPDREVGYGATDMEEGIDKELELALSLARQRKQ